MTARADQSFGVMLRACLVACMSLLLFMGHPAAAHGEETHGEDSVAAETVANETPVVGEVAEGAAPANVRDTETEPDASFGTLLKNLHPATVHFAIALFIVAGIVEGIAILCPSSPRLTAATDIMLVAGGAGAVIAALFGWVHTGIWLGGDTVMQTHRWLGTGLAAVGAGLAWLGWRSPRSRTGLRALLFIVVIAVFVQSYLGGELGHGAGHLWAH